MINYDHNMREANPAFSNYYTANPFLVHFFKALSVDVNF